jgi:hypothetical protein
MAASKRFEKLNTISLNLFRKVKTHNTSIAASPKQANQYLHLETTDKQNFGTGIVPASGGMWQRMAN